MAQKSSIQWGWEPLVAEENWDDVENWWKAWFLENPDQPDALIALLEALRRAVPTISVENGMERLERRIRSSDAPDLWQGRYNLKGATIILELGELEAAAEGDPMPSSESWAIYRKVIEKHLDQFTRQKEVTSGVEEFSRKAHAEQAQRFLHEIDFSSRFATSEIDFDEDRLWFTEAISEIAYLAFEAGRHTQAAWGKEFEQLAVIRLKNQRRFTQNNEGRAELNAQRALEAKRWHAHARLVMDQFTKTPPTDSDCASWTLAQWTKVGEVETRPEPPKKKTLQNWLSARKLSARK